MFIAAKEDWVREEDFIHEEAADRRLQTTGKNHHHSS
jgi:hypothetical protein